MSMSTENQEQSKGGFRLGKLLIALIVLAIIAAIAIPAFLDSGQQESPTEVPTSAEPTTTTEPEDEPTVEPTTEPEDEPSVEPTEGTTVSKASFAEVGDCIDLKMLASVVGGISEQLPTVDCAEEHDAQVIGVVELPDGDYEDYETLQNMMLDQCEPAFESFVGVPVDDSMLLMDGLFPSEESWTKGDREAICLTFYPDLSTTTESFEGSRI